MSDQYPPDDLSLPPSPDDQATLDSLDAILARPELWAEPSDGVEADVISAILSADQVPTVPPTWSEEPSEEKPEASGPDELALRRDVRTLEARPGRGRTILGAAAVFLVAAIGTLAVLRLPSSEPAGQIVALAGAGSLAEVTAEAVVRDEGNGLGILLDASDLPPAPDGMFYAAWMVQPEPKVRIPIGTFHRRGGDGEIELWSGVASETFSTLSVTLQSEQAPADPGEVVLLGQIG